MDIAVIGAGSIGMLLGSYLSESGLDVTMLVRSEEQKDALNEKGICRVNEDGSKSVFPVYATSLYSEIADAKILIVAVKYSDLKPVFKKIKNEEITAPLLFIQNGIGHFYLVNESDFPHVAFVTVEHGALKSGHRTVIHNGVGKITIGKRFGDINRYKLLEHAANVKFPIIRHENAEYILLRKVLINCLINPLTTILGVTNGELLTNPYGHQLMKDLYEELIEAFPEMEAGLSFADVELICRSTAKNHSSMFADFLAKRPMEIETIVSAFIQKAYLRKCDLTLLKTYEKILLALDEKAER